MNRRTVAMRLYLICLVTAFLILQPTLVAKAQGDVPARRDITGTIVGVGGRYGGRTRPFDLRINRYSTPEEIQRLNAALQSGGQDGLLSAFSGMEVGRIRIGNGVGIPVNAIIPVPEEGGEVKLIALYQRPIGFFELRSGARSQDYKLGYAEIFLRRNGLSEGTFIPAAKVRLRDGNTWEVEDFGEFPARLMGLRVHTSGNANH